VADSRLPESWLQKIGQSTVDCFPWELSYIPANQLNYHPRPLIQLGCATNYILDKRNADFLRSDKAPQFIIWHKGWCEVRLCSIDERYLLSDDLLTITAMLNRYRIVDSTATLLLLSRTDSSLLSKPHHAGEVTGKWNEWITCSPIDSNEVLTAHVYTQRTLKGKLKTAFFKEHEYYIEYQLADGRVIRHRFIKESEKSGIWIQPYLFYFNNNLNGEKVQFIRIVPTNQSTSIVPTIKIEWKKMNKLERNI
jgi:hypothetical protein